MPEPHEILLIDRDAGDLMGRLEPAAEAHDCHLLTAQSVEEGLEMLSQYGGLIDAVVLDLSTHRERERGEDGLARIKEVYRDLPVFVLTADTAEENVRTGVEAARNGAFDYFPKTDFDPQHLFIQARQVIAYDRRERRHRQRAESAAQAGGEAPFVLCEAPGGEDGGPHAAFFAFSLHRIARPRDDEEDEDATEAALTWHHDLLNFLALAPPEARLHLRYLNAPPAGGNGALPTGEHIGVALIARLAGRTEQEARAAAVRFRRELAPYLHGNAWAGAGVYRFVPVRSEDVLRELLVPFLPRQAQRLTRKTATGRFPDLDPALRELNVPPEEHIEVRLPTHTPPPRARSLGHLCQLLRQQPAETLVEVVLRPARLAPAELDRLRAVAAPREDRAGPPSELSPAQEEAFARRSEALIQQADRCFQVDLYLAQDGDDAVSGTLRAAAATNLLGRTADARAEDTRAEVEQGMLRLEPGAVPTGAGRLARLFAVEEAERIFRLPLPSPSGTPGLTATHPAHEFVPDDLSSEGPVLGLKETGGETRRIRIRPKDLRRHVYALGQTGTGKTTMLRAMVQERLEAGTGVGLIDPHGDLWERAHDVVPKARRDDVVIFDPGDPTSDVRLNLLEYDEKHPQQKSLLIEELFEIFREDNRPDWMGPMFQSYMRNACLLAMESREAPGTLLDVVKIFQDDAYRSQLLDGGPSTPVQDFWTKEAANVSGEASIEEIAPYITSKLNTFVYNDTVRRLVGSPKSTIDFREIMDEGKILLAKLPKGELGAFGVRLLGTVLFARLLMAALAREELAPEDRRDFVLFVDEFQTFTSEAAAAMLSEARKYRLGLVLANQALGQLDDDLREAVLGNVGSLVFLRPGAPDYPTIQPYVSPPFTREEILNLPNFTGVARLLAQGQPTRPFLFDTPPPLADSA